MTGGSDERAAVRWLFGFVRPQARALLQVLALSVLATGFALVQPYLTKLLIDDGLIGRDMGVILWLCGILAAVSVVSAVLGGLNRWLHTALSGRILFALREHVYRHLATLAPSFYAARPTGDIMTRLDGDIAEIQRFSTDSLLALVNGILALIGSLAIMLWLSPMLTLIAFLLLPLQIAWLRAMRPRILKFTRIARERAADITTFLIETLSAMKFVQSVSAGDREAERLQGLNATYLSDQLRLQMTNYVTGAVPGVLMTLATALVFIAGGYLVVNASITLGTLIAFSVYLARAAGPVQTFLGLYAASQRARVSLARVMELSREQPLVRSPARPQPPASQGRGAIRFEDVGFSYPGGDGRILDGVSIDIPAGRKTAIIGASGAGKSTVTDLLHRHYDPGQGRILLDGVELAALDLADLRRLIAVVGQDVMLFRGAIDQNIRYARPDASLTEIRAAAAMAQIDEFIQALPDGYDTIIGERGARLSGGQRQRLAIARALLQDPLVLIFDEATSGVDEATEALLIGEIDRLFAGRTRIVIGHRESARAGADAIFELAGGKLRPPKKTNRG